MLTQKGKQNINGYRTALKKHKSAESNSLDSFLRLELF